MKKSEKIIFCIFYKIFCAKKIKFFGRGKKFFVQKKFVLFPVSRSPRQIWSDPRRKFLKNLFFARQNPEIFGKFLSRTLFIFDAAREDEKNISAQK
jgi:hypothetical protein